MENLKEFVEKKEKDLSDLIKLIPKIEKIKNPHITAPIHKHIAETIISEGKQIRELKEIVDEDKTKPTKERKR